MNATKKRPKTDDPAIVEFRRATGLRIKVRRVELELEQKDIAESMKVAQSKVSGWETGIRPLPMEDAINLAKALRTSVAYLAGERPREAA